MKRTIVVAILICLCLSLCGCAKDTAGKVLVLGTPTAPEQTTLDMIYTFTDAVIHGKVLEKSNEFYTNENGDKTNKKGYPIRNTWVTEYQVEIYEVYKGEITEDIITVRTFNDLAPRDIPADEADDSFYFGIGDECVIGLYYSLDQAGYYAGKDWVSIYAERSYFLPGENEGGFVSPYGLTVNLATLAEDIAEN